MNRITKPTLVIDKNICLRNIERMAKKAGKNTIKFRPHFKTHQSAIIGDWFREFGVDSITVSSVQMAIYFAKNGWKDITVAFPLNLLEIENINKLASKIELNIVVENIEGAEFLVSNISDLTGVFLKIDTGYNRTGIEAAQTHKIDDILELLSECPKLSFKGFLSHTGHSYSAKSRKQIKSRHSDALFKLKSLKKHYKKDHPKLEVSLGDTPSTSICDNFDKVDEIRPGNFVFYDLTQESLGACQMEDIAVKMHCPVVARHLSRNEIIIYGGAIHFSKDSLIDEDGKRIFGRIIIQKNEEKILLNSNNYLAKISQEHGTIKVETDYFKDIQVGDLVEVIPIHSCLTANVMGWMQTTEGEFIEMMPKY